MSSSDDPVDADDRARELTFAVGPAVRPSWFIRWVQPVAALMCAALGLTDLLLPHGLHAGVLLFLPVLISTRFASRSFTVGLAAFANVFTALDAYVDSAAAPPGTAPWLALVHAVFEVAAVWLTAGLGLVRRTSEEDLQRSRALNLAILKSIGDGVITTDADGSILFMNEAAARITGHPVASALGRPLGAIYRLLETPLPTDSVALEGMHMLRGGRRMLRCRDGLEIPIEPTTTSLYDEAGNEFGAVLIFRDVTERESYENSIKRLAFRDELTRLPNRVSFFDRLGLEMSHARRNGTLLGLLFLDLNGLKRVNDTLGHRAGDQLLFGFAKCLKRTVREGDTVARIGGDEFTVLVPGAKKAEDVELVAKKILAALEVPIAVLDRRTPASASIGVAIFPTDAAEADPLVAAADQAMYRAKRRGAGCMERAVPTAGPPRSVARSEGAE